MSGFETFAAGIGNNNETYYAIFNTGTTQWEVGRGTLDGSSANLARTEVISSSNYRANHGLMTILKYLMCSINDIF